MIRGVLLWAFAGAVAGLVLGGVDALVLVLGAAEMFFATRELAHTALASIGICAGAGALVAALVGVVAEALIAGAAPGRFLDRRYVLELVLTALLAAPLDLAGWLLTSGPQASRLPLRPLVVGVVAFLVGAALAVAIVRLSRYAARRASRGYAVLAGGLLAAAVLTWIDLTVLVRLYPVFHVGLTAAALLLCSAGLRLVLERDRRPWLSRIAALLALAAIVGGAFSLGFARRSQNPRYAITERTAAAADVIVLARAIRAPPRAQRLEEIDPAPPLENRPGSGQLISRPGSPVFLITVDAMRHDVLIPGQAGDRRRVSPNLDALAARSVVFDRAYTPIPHTSYAITSMLTGKYVHPLFQVPSAPRVHETWPEIMGRFRYRTGGFFTKAVVFIDRSRFEPYLRQGFGFHQALMDYRVPATERVRQTIEFLETTRAEGHGSKVFAWTHFFEPHEPYDPKCLRFGERDRDRYECEIARVDEAVGPLLTYLDEHYPDAILIASSDHGEEFGDHGGRYHGTTLHDEQVRVPLMIRVPGIEPRRVDEPVNLVDLLGTTLSMLDIPIPARLRSVDLTGLILGRDQDPHQTLCQVRERVMIVRDGHKLICDRDADICRLYDLEADPGEQRSIADQQPERVAALEARIRGWEQSHARIELRPVVEDGRAQGWPATLRRALAGDESATIELLDLIREDRAAPVRRKAAELVAATWGDRPTAPLAALDPADDPEVAAWITVARSHAGDAVADAELTAILPQLERLTPPWRAVTLARLAGGDRGAIPDACAIAGDETASHEERWQAVDLLSRTGDRRATRALTALIDDYQLALDVADALAELGHRDSVPILIKRLKRERFPERRAAIAAALARIGDRRAIAPIAGELAREQPAADALEALVALGAAAPGGKVTDADPETAEITIWSPVGAGLLSPKRGLPNRLFLLTAAEGDGGTVVVSCGGEELARHPIASGEQTGHVPLDGCDEALSLALEPMDIQAEIKAAAVVVPLNP
jgi:arylsulfatase A-like enzyme/HEAT repeat protein